MNVRDAIEVNARTKTWDGKPALDLAVARRYDSTFTRSDGVDVRDIPKVQHPYTGKYHFDWGGWPRQ